MLDAHAARIEAAIRGCAVVATYALNTVQLSPNTGVEGEIMFVDGSRLVFFEFWRRMVGIIDLAHMINQATGNTAGIRFARRRKWSRPAKTSFNGSPTWRLRLSAGRT